MGLFQKKQSQKSDTTKNINSSPLTSGVEYNQSCTIIWKWFQIWQCNFLKYRVFP